MASNPSHSSSKRPAFKYQPLIEPDGIRLVLLHPAKDVSAELECLIEHVTLSDYNQDLINHYTALSYVWGDEKEKREIVVNGCGFFITANLYLAFCYIRDAKAVVKIWADAICINQTDTTERNHQVQHKGEVYSIARYTIIYLGVPVRKSTTYPVR
ncbi:Heterokaryon incompatibility protein (HET) domain containing protein [Hyaloscypha variabilis]